MYRKGELTLITPQCDGVIDEYGRCDNVSHDHRSNLDCREEYTSVGIGTAYLPHSCQEWVIGGKEEMKTLIEDLQEALDKIEGTNDQTNRNKTE